MICFVYRSPYQGLLGKHVRWLPDASVLDWFRRAFDESRPDPAAWLHAELGVEVYGLHTIFDKPRAKPESMRELRKLLKKHLYVEGKVIVGDHSVRALTDDDEVPLAYFFLDQSAVAERPGRLAYAVHEQWPLPADSARPSDGEPVTTIVTSQIGDVDWDTQGASVRLPGVRVPDLAAWLRRSDVHGDWPYEVVLLRAAVGPDDDLAAALDRVNRWGAWHDQYLDVDGLAGDQAKAHQVVRSVLARTAGLDEIPGPLGSRSPAKSRIEVGEHLAQASLHLDDNYGHQQFFVFDDVWAASHPALAKSMRRWFVKSWDPLKGTLKPS
ncbi:hypothetical protein SAMN04489716_2214 [Actinoplanes derwentensis]|uniref:Uncharacterized protein n=1 Tax=Actinoplanes derwentensis TaxID=113562 RepID=A0A1H1WS02_9ACTN|nr:hypothetical protein Ade03nite_59170 [Actinoplanes derwentensis]SDS99855.1 hypothetical protein SAMN04489716_2214 [Actinoplanes derwentensis]